MTVKENSIETLNTIKDGVTLIGVSKTKPVEMIKEAFDGGIRNFGENKVQDLTAKMDVLKDYPIKWHFIGHLQKNKVKYLVDRECLIHSIDSVELVREIEKKYGNKGRICRGLIQINIGREESKFGVLKEDLYDIIEEVEKSEFIKIEGLMAILPKENEEILRKYFKDMKNTFDKLSRESFKNIDMKFLSMGMTNDYLYAMDEGSNMVRVGRKIFGER